ncbi:5-oxoprolinase subunit B family protein [Halarchaeum nitratireducens]|uniref:Allophanate hydrolase n=1 Tax=Halarchaeum nitratireducens TaxID=489913 RepID=A0A830GDG9_9EURY|nr:carboxyltransferase domain-containing protein [Halarchaeum nitratireducens]GGN21198.1 allophanate hydrolase [Halarchaeum nitratireducens]
MASERITPVDLPDPRYEYGGDDHVFVDLAEEMSFTANFKAMAITQRVAERDIDGVVENCPGNASYMLRIDPDVVHPDDVIAELKDIEASIDVAEYAWESRVIDVPVLFEDPWTHETLMDFRDRHQDPDATDLEYSAELNGYDDVESFIDAFVGAPHMVTMVGFVPGLPWCFQMVPRERQLEVPKYVEPRTATPSRAVGFGGAFSVVYPVAGAGGYQLYGRTPVEVLDVDQELPAFEDSMVLPNPGDIINYRRIDRDEYDAIRDEVEAGTYEYDMADVTFSPEEFFEAPNEYNAQLLEAVA